MRSGQPNVLEINEWIVANLPAGSVIGIDPFLLSAGQARALKKLLETNGLSMKYCSYVEGQNPIDNVWNLTNTRPAPPMSPIRILDINIVGVSHNDKIKALQKVVVEKRASCLVVSMLDEVAWVLNIRGSDVQYNPVTICYLTIARESAKLFIHAGKVSDELRDYLLRSDVVVEPYEEVGPYLREIAAEGPVLLDPSRVNWALYLAAEGEGGAAGQEAPRVVQVASPVTFPKSVKNDSERVGIRACHVRDGVALTAFLHWLETAVRSGVRVTEFEVTERIEEFRNRMERHVGPSFSTIAGYAANGAIIHYKPEVRLSSFSSSILFSSSSFFSSSPSFLNLPLLLQVYLVN